MRIWKWVDPTSPGDLANPGIKPGSPALRADASLPEPPANSVLPWAALVDQPAEKPELRRASGAAEFLHCRLQCTVRKTDGST